MISARRGDLLGGRVRPVGERARMHAEQGQPMPEYVVHLARNLLAGPELALLRLQPGHSLGPIGAVPQRLQELAPGPDVQSPSRRRRCRSRSPRPPPRRRPPACWTSRYAIRDTDVDREHQQGDPQWPVDRHGQNQDEGRSAGRLGVHGDHRGNQGELHRPAAPEPQRQAQQHPGDQSPARPSPRRPGSAWRSRRKTIRPNRSRARTTTLSTTQSRALRPGRSMARR